MSASASTRWPPAAADPDERVGLELARAPWRRRSTASCAARSRLLQGSPPLVTLDHDDLPGFRERARRVLETQPHWAAMSSPTRPATDWSTPDFATRSADLPSCVEQESFDGVLRTRQPAVGSLARARRALAVPGARAVVRDGELRYVLTALVKPENDPQRAHPPARARRLDHLDLRRPRAARGPLARARGEPGRAAVADPAGGVAGGSRRRLRARPTTLEGDRIYAPYSRLAPSGWTAALGIAHRLGRSRRAYRSLAIYGGGILLSIALGTLVGARGRAQHQPADRRPARGGAGPRPARGPRTVPETSIQEIRDVAAALARGGGGARERRGASARSCCARSRQARATAEAADRAKDEFLAVLSHELRTPLNAVYGWARMLQSGQIHGRRAVDAGARRHRAQRRRAGAAHRRPARRLARSPRARCGSTSAASTWPRSSRRRSTPCGRPRRPRPSASQTVLDPPGGAVTGDPARLQQVVWNLLMNAVKFTPKGGRVQVHLQRVNSHVEIVVSDTGQGIAPDVLPARLRALPPGRQLEHARGTAGSGSGWRSSSTWSSCTAAACRRRAPAKARGATFIVRLPLALAEIAAGSRRACIRPRVATEALARWRPRSTASACWWWTTTATRWSWRPRSWPGAGAEVRDVSVGAPRRSTQLRDVAARRARVGHRDAGRRRLLADPPGARARREEGGKTPAVALTAYGRTQDRLRALAAGYSMHVPKPVDPGELTTIVASVAGGPAPPRST